MTLVFMKTGKLLKSVCNSPEAEYIFYNSLRAAVNDSKFCAAE